MKKSLKKLTVVLLLVLVIFAADAYAEKTKIRVVVENASIRVKPDLQGDIIKSPPLGSVFESEQKDGEWYEISVRTEVGVLITGYIHEMFVEVAGADVVPPEPEQEAEQMPEKKAEPTPIPAPPPDTMESSGTKPKRVELAMRVGYTTGYKTENSTYAETFSGGVLANATASGTMSTEHKKPLGFDGTLNIFVTKGFGFQLKFDSNTKAKMTDSSMSTFNMAWNWDSGESYDTQDDWNVTGDISLFILSGNLVYKVQTQGLIAPVISGGVSYFSGIAKADTSVGYGTTWSSDGFRYIDYFVIPAMVDASLGGIGFNVGAGIDFVFSSSVALNIEGRYFARGKIEENWMLQPGTYSSTINDAWTLTLDQADVDEMAAGISPFSLTPSFFKISAGFKFMF